MFEELYRSGVIADYFVGEHESGVIIEVRLQKENDRYFLYYFHPDESSTAPVASFPTEAEAREYVQEKYAPFHVIEYANLVGKN